MKRRSNATDDRRQNRFTCRFQRYFSGTGSAPISRLSRASSSSVKLNSALSCPAAD
jgi:hypothetical protein